MVTPLRPTDKIDLVELSRRISVLIINYCDAFSACRTISGLSVLPLPKLYLQVILWALVLEVCIFVVPIDIILFLVRLMFGRPKVVIGRSIYAFLGEPLRSVWKGEISAFKLVRLRYLTRLLLFYRAQSKINALHRVFNRQHLDLLVADPPDDRTISKAENFQKSFDLFQKITTDTYQIGALAIGGPFVALFTITVQQGFLPLVNFVWGSFGFTSAISPELIGTLGGFFVLFALVAIWILVSAWMDMRSVIAGLGIREIECGVYEYARIKLTHQIPFDILLYIGLVGAYASVMYYFLWRAFFGANNLGDTPLQMERLLFQRYNAVFGAVTTSFVLGLGLIALARRLWLSSPAAPSPARLPRQSKSGAAALILPAPNAIQWVAIIGIVVVVIGTALFVSGALP